MAPFLPKYARGLLALAALILASCSELAEDPNQPRPRRAVESPLAIASPNTEVMGRPQATVEIIRVDLPNNKDEQAQVRTIGDSLAALAQTAPAAPATQKAPQQPVPEVTLPANPPIVVVQKKNPADTLVPGLAGDQVTLLVISESGIGTAVIERAGESWPPSITVRFSHGTRAFARLEGFNANEMTEAGARVPLRAEVNKEGATATITIPGFVRSSRIAIEWVNEYR